MGLLADHNPMAFEMSAPAVPMRRPEPISNRQNQAMLEARGLPDIKARFDLQFTTDENKSLWSLGDFMSVDAMANFGVRRILRMRCRYAYHNNPYAMGAANRLANFVIGSGPKLHLSGDKAINAPVEAAFHKWAHRVQLARKLRTSRAARFYNGEGFNLLRTNPKVRHPVKLDVFEIEADQVSSPLFGVFPAQYPDQWFDGVTLDPWGNKDSFQILRQHPGAFGAFLVMGYEFDTWPAEYVLHDYARLRPFQQRGIPEMAPAAQKFEELRRYAAAELAAAETAADYAGFIKTTSPTGEGTQNEWGVGDTVPIKRRSLAVLPADTDIAQMRAEHPTTAYNDYVMSCLIEISQTLNMPLFILTGDARLANMSSAYVATQSFIQGVNTDREEYGPLLDQTFEEWLAEARLVSGLIADGFPADPDYSWRWDRVINHADPLKMSQSQRLKLQNGISPQKVFSEDNLDFDEEVSAAAQNYGVSEDDYRASLFQSLFAQRGNPPPASIEPGVGDTPDKEDVPDDDDE